MRSWTVPAYQVVIVMLAPRLCAGGRLANAVHPASAAAHEAVLPHPNRWGHLHAPTVLTSSVLRLTDAPFKMCAVLVFLSVATAGVVTAYVFTWIPEWTTWMLVTLMALYDVVAVLVPGGPLKMLVELAQEREEVRLAAANRPCYKCQFCACTLKQVVRVKPGQRA